MENFYCAVCGAQNPIENIYCTKCGKSVDGPATEPSKVQPTGSAIWAHLGPWVVSLIGFYMFIVEGQGVVGLFSWIVPLLILKGKNSDEFTKSHARESMNFLLFWLIWDLVIYAFGYADPFGSVSGLLIFFDSFINIYQFVVVILAIIAAATRKPFIYPLLPIRFIKS